jgi:hypothetical protein
MDEESLPDGWTNEGCPVGMRPMTDRHGIGEHFGVPHGLKMCVTAFPPEQISPDLAHNQQQKWMSLEFFCTETQYTNRSKKERKKEKLST